MANALLEPPDGHRTYLGLTGEPCSGPPLQLPELSDDQHETDASALKREFQVRTSAFPHILRHSVATTMLENGATEREVREFLGHKSLNSTQRYTHVRPVRLKEASRKVDYRG